MTSFYVHRKDNVNVIEIGGELGVLVVNVDQAFKLRWVTENHQCNRCTGSWKIKKLELKLKVYNKQFAFVAIVSASSALTSASSALASLRWGLSELGLKFTAKFWVERLYAAAMGVDVNQGSNDTVDLPGRPELK